MTIDSAIKYLAMMEEAYPIGYSKDYFHALKLGMEALKAWQESRNAGGVLNCYLLPSETET